MGNLSMILTHARIVRDGSGQSNVGLSEEYSCQVASIVSCLAFAIVSIVAFFILACFIGSNATTSVEINATMIVVNNNSSSIPRSAVKESEISSG